MSRHQIPARDRDHTLPKACTVIYAPKGQAGEYAPLAANPYIGCGHECLYCYVPLAMHLQRKTFNAGAVKRLDFLRRLQDDAALCARAGFTGQVMLTFSSDPYHLDDTQPTRWALEILADHGLGFCTLTKGGARALADIDLFRPDRDAFACTLTTLDDAFSRKWERRAAAFPNAPTAGTSSTATSMPGRSRFGRVCRSTSINGAGASASTRSTIGARPGRHGSDLRSCPGGLRSGVAGLPAALHRRRFRRAPAPARVHRLEIYDA